MYDPEHVVAEELVEVDELWTLMMNEDPERRILLGRAISLKYANRLAGHIDKKWHKYLNSTIIYHKTQLAPSDLECMSKKGRQIYKTCRSNHQETYKKTMDITTIDNMLINNHADLWVLKYEMWPCIRHRIQFGVEPRDVSSEYVRRLYSLRKNWWPRIWFDFVCDAYLLASPYVGKW
jgi:hypothetical protein